MHNEAGKQGRRRKKSKVCRWFLFFFWQHDRVLWIFSPPPHTSKVLHLLFSVKDHEKGKKTESELLCIFSSSSSKQQQQKKETQHFKVKTAGS